MHNRSNILVILAGLLPLSLCVAAGVGAYQMPSPWRYPRVLLFHEDGFEVLIPFRLIIVQVMYGSLSSLAGINRVDSEGDRDSLSPPTLRGDRLLTPLHTRFFT